MSMYTTGEIARLCGVSVRTVQYYDSRNILVPSALSEGGRRLYSEEDLKRMRIICFLREAGISISAIGQLFSEEHPENVITLLLDQQEEALREEMARSQKKLSMVENIRRELKNVKGFSVDSIGDIAYVMKNKNKLKKLRWFMGLTGIPLEILKCTSIVLWITKGDWWLFLLWVFLVVPWGIGVSIAYYKRVAYICPECHEVFTPGFREVFWTYHTPTMRRLTCTQCGHKGMCVEVYHSKEATENG